MVLTIIGSDVSTCTRRVKVVLFEKGVDFVIKPIDWTIGEHKTEAHLEKQPFGQMPVLDDEGFILFESRAIGRYIAAKYANQGTKLIPDPKDLKAVALFEQAACVEQADFEPSVSGIAVEKLFNPFKGLATDEDKFQKHVETLNAKLDGYERMLTKTKYLAGDIIGVDVSTCTRRVKVVLFEKGVDFVIKPVDWVGPTPVEALILRCLMSLPPIPVAVHRGAQKRSTSSEAAFWASSHPRQSRAIGRYIATKYANQGTKLIPDPKDLKAVALFEQAACVEQADFEPYVSGIAVEKLFNPLRGLAGDEDKFKKNVEALNAKLDGYERMLTRTKYLAGDEITLVDLWHLPHGEIAEKFAPEVFESHPKFYAAYNLEQFSLLSLQHISLVTVPQQATSTMVLVLHGWHLSTCTRRVKCVLYEKGVEFTLKHVDIMAGEAKTEAYRQIQPFSQIPVLEDEGFYLFESRAITRYIAAKYADQGTKLLPNPTDLKAVALFEQAACIEQADFDPYASEIAVEKVFKPHKGVAPNEEAFKKLVENLNTKLDGYERLLSKHKYLAGDELTLADLWHLPYGEIAERFAPEIWESHPKFNAWWQALKNRPSWIKANEDGKF
ncbi:hypothetical protein FRC04_003728 [Tulasnella sp. 424]|nr:hypothetical protein FRC04_003728 [Tulasnella sp. 424]